MGLATLAGRPFRLDPTSVSWDFTTKTNDIPTVGGKVVQVFGTKLSDMRLEGSFGRGGWKQQAKFLKEMKAVADEQVSNAALMRSTRDPIRFTYPPRKWDFLVFLKAFTTPDGGRSVVLDNGIVAPRWGLTLFIVEDNSGLTKVAQDQYLARLSQGLGWKQTDYNGPMGSLELQENLGGRSVQDFLLSSFPQAQMATGNQGVGDVLPSAGSAPASVTSTQAMVQEMAAAEGWTGAEWDALYAIVQKESEWKNTAQNKTSTAFGLFQFLDSTWATVGATKTSDPRAQTVAGIAYIKQRYGTPSKAWAFHQKNNYY